MEQQKFSVTGTIYRVLNPETRGTYTSRKLVLEIPGFKDRTELVCIEFGSRKMDVLDNVREGEQATVHFELTGRESPSNPGRFFTNLSGWRIERNGNGGGQDRHNGGGRQYPKPQQNRKTEPATDDGGEYDF